MPKKNKKTSIYSVSENLYKKQDKEGAGTGSGVEYKSGLDVIRVPSSKGNKKHKIPGIKSERLIQLMSNLERDTFLFFDLSKNVKDIREQFPLDRCITLAIAEKLGIGHPKAVDSHTGQPMAIRMTTDLLIDYVDKDKKEKQLAIHIKPANQIKDRTLEKIRIEQAYWLLKGIKFLIITDKCIPKEIVDNLEFVKGYALKKEASSHSKEIKSMIIESISTNDETINKLCSKIDEELKINKGESLNTFYQMIATREIDVDLRRFSIGPITNSSELRKHTLTNIENIK